MDQLLMRAEEVARALGLGRSKVYEMMQSGELPVVRIGRSVRVSRAARLADVPEAGGLDFLTSLPRIAPRRDLMVRPGKESAEEAAAREAVRQAEEALLAARKISDDAERGLRDAQVEADDAGRRLRLAQKEAHVSQTALDRARKAATSAGSELKQAEARLADAKANLPS
jgi:excisionase family DNA binding protein